MPADIEAAIDELEHASIWFGSSATSGTLSRRETARAALDAAILARLTAAEAQRDTLRDKLDEMFSQLMLAEGSCAKLREENARLCAALEPFAAICDAEHMKYVRDEQVLELVTRTDVIVSEKLRGRDFRAARAALTDSAAG